MSDTPYSSQFDDIYFSPDDGLAETQHVFLDSNNLPESWAGKDQFHIAELGFGTGLNFLAAAALWSKTATPEQHLIFTSLEKYPLSAEEIGSALAKWQTELPHLEALLKNYPLRVSGTHPVTIAPNITLVLHFGDINTALQKFGNNVNAWFLDGFAPAKNPDMWQDSVFQLMAEKSANDASFATFTAAGLVKRGLQEAGFTVEKIRGFGRKREMLCGRIQQQKPCNKMPKTVAVIGGGLAGCAAAWLLKQQGFAPEIYEAGDTLASGASGNLCGIINPRFSKHFNDEAWFYSSAFSTAVTMLRHFKGIDYRACGNLHLINDDAKLTKFSGVIENWGWHSDHISMVDVQEASNIAGISIANNGLYLRDGVQLNPAALTAYYAQNIPIHFGKKPSLTKAADGWDVAGKAYDAVILACGIGIKEYEQANDIQLDTVRGQMGMVSATDYSQQLKCNLHYGGYISAPNNGRHALGATFQPWLKDTNLRDEDHERMISLLSDAAPELAEGLKLEQGRASFRVTTKQRFPIIKQIDEHLYVSAAHGSHGIASSLYAAWQILFHLRGL